VLIGKWCLFPGPEQVDALWAAVVRGLSTPGGALAAAGSARRILLATSSNSI
jgi:hypothetical protein